MTGERNLAISPAAKAARTRASFLRKVEVVEGWAATGYVNGGWFPKSLAELAAWEDPGLEVEAWRKANIVSDSRYRDLRERYDLAMGRLLAALGKPKKKTDDVLRRAVAEQHIVALAQQLVTERLAHKETQKLLRLALAANRLIPAPTRKPDLRLVRG